MAIAIRAKARLDQTAVAGPLGIHPRARGPRGSGKALSQPRRRPSANLRRHSVGRCLRWLCGRVGARRPARAHAGGMLDRRKFQDHYRHGVIGRVAGSRLHFKGAAGRSAARAGYLLSGTVRSTTSRASRAKRGSGISAPRPRREARSRLSGPAIPRARAGASIRPAADMRTYRTMLENRAGFLHSFRRSHLCRLPGAIRAEAAERRHLAQHRDARRNPRSRTASRSFAAITNTICSTRICAPSTRRCRCSRNGTIMR